MAKAQKGDLRPVDKAPAPPPCWKELLQSALEGQGPGEGDTDPFRDAFYASR